MIEERVEYLGLTIGVAPGEPKVVSQTVHVTRERRFNEPAPLVRSRSPAH